MKKQNFFTASPEMKSEYCAQVVKIGELKPIEGSDYLAQVIVSGTSMVIRKDEFKTGDYAIYCKNETALNPDFLSLNNLYEVGEFMRNANREKVIELQKNIYEYTSKEVKTEEDLKHIQELEAHLKSLCGFFNKHGRVKMINLRKVPSFGFLIKLDTLANWKPQVKDIDLSEYILNEEMGIGMDFDTVCGEKFIQVYIPPIKERPARNSQKREKQRQKKVERFERISKEDFKFHYNTSKLEDNIWRIQPTDCVTISCKKHGTSAIYANIPVKKPIKLPLYNRFINYSHKKLTQLVNWLSKKVVPNYKIEYGDVYSSRGVIKNQYINEKVTNGFYGTDVWGDINEIIKPYIEKGMTVYGEICGYLTGSDKMIQKGYDYGCKIGENFFMPYRITTTNEDGTKREWEVSEVYDWTVKLISEHPELKDKIQPITILYNGSLSNLYPDISIQNHWHENVLEAMKNDKKHFYMECNDPVCKNKVPYEGIVLRKNEDPISEAFKLKTLAFFKREKANIDAGEVDMEMSSSTEGNEEETNI